MTLNRATVEQMLASEFRPDDELIDALAEDWLRQEEALQAIAADDDLLDANPGAFEVSAARRMQAQARIALRPQTEEEKP